MILDALSRQASQCSIAGAHLGSSCCGLPPIVSCIGGGSTGCDKSLQPADIDALLVANQIGATRVERELTRQELETEIAARRPVLAWQDGNGNPFDHVILFVGKHDETMFLIADPCLNSYTFATHDELLKHSNRWIRTWFNIG